MRTNSCWSRIKTDDLWNPVTRETASWKSKLYVYHFVERCLILKKWLQFARQTGSSFVLLYELWLTHFKLLLCISLHKTVSFCLKLYSFQKYSMKDKCSGSETFPSLLQQHDSSLKSIIKECTFFVFIYDQKWTKIINSYALLSLCRRMYLTTQGHVKRLQICFYTVYS